MTETDQSLKAREDFRSQFKGIRMTDDDRYGSIVFVTNGLHTAMPTHELVRTDYGEEIDNAVELIFRRYLVRIEGNNLEKLFTEIARNRVFAVEEQGYSNQDQTLTYASRIQIVELGEEQKQVESASEDEDKTDPHVLDTDW